MGIPSFQTADFWYMGMVEEAAVYALTGADPWVDFPDPGAVHGHIDGIATATQQKDKEAIFISKKGIYDSHTNARHAIIYAINFSVPRGYTRKNTGGRIRENIYKVNACPRTILQTLRYKYRRVQPIEKTHNSQLYDTP